MKRLYRSAAAIAAVTALVALVPTTAAEAHRRHHNHHNRVHIVRLPDCEDVDVPTFPCVTKDEGTWRIVTSENPYRYIPTRLCMTEDEIGSRIVSRLPCVWDTWSAGDSVPAGSVNRRWMVFFRGRL